MGMKPIATGAKIVDNKLVNEDAELIMKHCSKKASYDLINPFVYELPAGTDAQLGVGLLPGDIVDTNAVFAEVDADEILGAEFWISQIDRFVKHGLLADYVH